VKLIEWIHRFRGLASETVAVPIRLVSDRAGGALAIVFEDGVTFFFLPRQEARQPRDSLAQLKGNSCYHPR
jgi:hypothetical protein